MGMSFAQTSASDTIQFIFTSDAHYGITRAKFQGSTKVNSAIVNNAMIAKMNTISGITLPDDGGVNGNKLVGPIDFIVEGGDIANREEGTGAAAIQSASISWKQFQAGYIDSLNLTDRSGKKSPLFLIPGNHDVTNAIGFYKTMTPATDTTSMVEIYNRMMNPSVPETNTSWNYAKDRVNYSRDFGGIHFIFITVWPDSENIVWMNEDLKNVSPRTPVILFSHDEPAGESKHFTNPNGKHDINSTDKFENLLSDQLADGKTVDTPNTIEQRNFEKFLIAHPNVTAYFHGNDHLNRYYDWTGPDNGVVLRTVGVDSPMKGTVSSMNETKLSFELVSIDPASRTMSVRNCMWNVDPAKPDAPLAWGAAVFYALYPRPGR
jgi:hypothetical protein